MGANAESILVIGFGGKGVGDQIIATPFIRNLALNFPDSAIDFAASSIMGVELLKFDPNLREVFVLDMDCFRLGGRNKSFNEKLSCLKHLRSAAYDRVYILNTKLRPAIAAFLSGAKERIGYASYHREFLLTAHWQEPVEKNLVDRFLDLLSLSGMTVSSNEVEMFLREEEIAEAEKLLGRVFSDPMPIVAIAPFAADMRRTWGGRAFSELVSRCNDDGIGIVVLGSPADRPLMDEGHFPAGKNIVDLVGKLTIRQTAALIKKSAAFVGNDSGLAHVAGAVGTKGIVIGYHVTKVWYPSAPCIQTIIRDPGCTACDLNACVGETSTVPPCFQAVPVEEVFTRLKSLLDPSEAKFGSCTD